MDIQTGTRTGTVFQAKFFLAYLLPVIIFFFFFPQAGWVKKKYPRLKQLNNREELLCVMHQDVALTHTISYN